MSLLSGIAEKATANAGVDQEERVSSTGTGITESGAYVGIIKMAKVIEANSGAIGIAIEIQREDEKIARVTEWIQSGDAKGNKTTYTDKEGNEVNLPGFTKIKNLNFLLTGVFGVPVSEDKQIKEYDWEQKKEVLVNREVVTDWLNKPIGFCIQMTMEDKYDNETTFITKSIVEHFYDAVTNQFGSEKINSSEATNLDKFKTYIEKTPIKDKRKRSKGATTNEQGSGNTNTPATTETAGF